MDDPDAEELAARVVSAIHSVYDPEFGIPVDDLGLIYDIAFRGGEVSVSMTLTTQHCPAGDVLVGAVNAVVESVPGVQQVSVSVVWDPVWTPDMLNGRAREMLGRI